MPKMIYGQLVINMLADEKAIRETEGVLFSLSDVLLEDILGLVERWNKQNQLIKIEVKEAIGVIEESELE